MHKITVPSQARYPATSLRFNVQKKLKHPQPLLIHVQLGSDGNVNFTACSAQRQWIILLQADLHSVTRTPGKASEMQANQVLELAGTGGSACEFL